VIIAALTCNIAWGLTDAMMYLLSNTIDRGHRIHVANQILSAEPDAAVELVRAEVGDWVNVSLADNQLRQVVEVMRRNRTKPDRAALLRSDLKGAASVFVTVVLATFPPILPLLFVRDPDVALRLSNLISVLFLIFLGAVLDRLIGARARFALIMPLLGMALVAIIIALGG
jgi:VIT1/CCC1 family predicted Fe2+/Mn2+ transporter